LKQKKPSISEHLASLSVQYGVYPAELFQALVAARDAGKTTCENLTIEYRGSVDDEAIFLIKEDGKVVSQFRVTEQTLQQNDHNFESWVQNDRIRKQIAKQNPAEPVTTEIRDLRHGMKKVNVEAHVVETPEPKMVHTQFGNSALLTNAIIEDDSGRIQLCLWDQQVNAVAVGDKIKISGASVSTFKGEKQLRLGKTGTVTVLHNDGDSTVLPPTGNGKKVVCA
jgi:replication factor A1